MSQGKFQRIDRYEGDIISPVTGEVMGFQGTRATTILKGVKEENFIKIYYDVYIASLGANTSAISPFLIEVGKRMSYSEDGQIVVLVKSTKQQIAQSLGVSLGSVNNMISKCVKLRLLIRVDRSTYVVNPMIMAKGEWDNVMALQLTYNAKLHELAISNPTEFDDIPKPKYIADMEKNGYFGVPVEPNKQLTLEEIQQEEEINDK